VLTLILTLLPLKLSYCVKKILNISSKKAIAKIGANDEDSTIGYIVNRQLINHSRDPNLIAINLPLFKKIAEENRQQIDIDAMKALLVNSKRYKFVNQKKIGSAILGKVVHCWIFKK
jgi:hypothetical protein